MRIEEKCDAFFLGTRCWVLGSSEGCFALAKLKFSLEAKLLSLFVACYNGGFHN